MWSCDLVLIYCLVFTRESTYCCSAS